MKKLLSTIAALAALTSTLTPKLTAAAVENTQGDYIPSPDNAHYTIVHGQLYANDGARWYVLRRPQFDSGLMAGGHFGKQERWCRVGGSRITSYVRTPSTFRNANKVPVMAQGANF